MSTEQTPLPPPVMWAQRSAVVLVTVNLEDCKDPIIKLDTKSVYFKGVGGTNKKLHEVTIPLYGEIDAEKSKTFPRDRCIELVLAKAKADGPYWPSLTSDKIKHHWIKCDFNKWQDEDESGEEGGGGGDFEEMLQKMGLGGAGGGAGPGGLGADPTKPRLDDLDTSSGDSDDEELPDLE